MALRAAQQRWSVRETEKAVQTAMGHASGPRVAAVRPRLSSDDEAVRRGIEAQLGLPVDLERRGRGGRVTVTFHDDGDLDALYRKLGGPQL
jgi:ParB-like chromosome segregation protein Spo0J